MKVIRERLNYSQQEFATMLGVAVSTVSRWENGKSPATFTVPQIKVLSRELNKLGLTVENLPDNLGPSDPSDEGLQSDNSI